MYGCVSAPGFLTNWQQLRGLFLPDYFTLQNVSSIRFSICRFFVCYCLSAKKGKKWYLLGWNVSFDNTFPCLWTFRVEYIRLGCFSVACTIFIFMKELENCVWHQGYSLMRKWMSNSEIFKLRNKSIFG